MTTPNGKKDERRVTTPISPLSPLRLSAPVFEIEDRDKKPPELAVPQQTEKQHRHQIHHPNQNKQKDGFLLDMNLPQASNTPQDLINGLQIKKVRELASIYLNTRKSLRADYNIVDPVKSMEVATDSEPQKIQISQKTISRAEKVKILLSIKYLFLQRLAESEEGDHPGVEGRYNPLQILRNRKIRAKHHEYPKHISIKELPLACNVFSKHNVSGHKPWRMPWAIELEELVSDSAWRKSHWHELRDPKGNLWFPPPEPQARPRLQDKLFDEANESVYNTNRLSSTSGTDSEHLFKITSTKSPHKRLKDKIKRRKKSISSSNNNSESDEEQYYPQRDLLKDQFFKRISPPPEDRLQDVEEAPNELLQSPPQFKVSDSSSIKEFDINDVSFRPVEKNNLELDELGPTDVDESYLLQERCDLATQELNMVRSNYSFFEHAIKFKADYLFQVYPQVARQVNHKLHNLINNEMKDIFQSTVSINDDYLPASEEIYNGFLDEIKSIIHLINNDYSIKIDNLLSGSDRSIGEISTSLSLELRKVNEKLDKLNTSLFTNNVVSDTINGEFTMKLTDSYNNKMLYFCLENLIVIMLRFVWVVVNFYKLFANLVKMIIRFVRYILF